MSKPKTKISDVDIKIRKKSCPPTRSHDDKTKYNRKNKHKKSNKGGGDIPPPIF